MQVDQVEAPQCKDCVQNDLIDLVDMLDVKIEANDWHVEEEWNVGY